MSVVAWHGRCRVVKRWRYRPSHASSWWSAPAGSQSKVASSARPRGSLDKQHLERRLDATVIAQDRHEGVVVPECACALCGGRPFTSSSATELSRRGGCSQRVEEGARGSVSRSSARTLAITQPAGRGGWPGATPDQDAVLCVDLDRASRRAGGGPRTGPGQNDDGPETGPRRGGRERRGDGTAR